MSFDENENDRLLQKEQVKPPKPKKIPKNKIFVKPKIRKPKKTK